jgi:hypothetical protein
MGGHVISVSSCLPFELIEHRTRKNGAEDEIRKIPGNI